MSDLVTQPPKSVGRPKGARNKITLLKLAAEESVRSEQAEKMLDVCRQVIAQALDGDFDSQKLVWQTIMSKSGSQDEKSGGAGTVGIIVRSDLPPQLVVDAQVIPQEDSNG